MVNHKRPVVSKWSTITACCKQMVNHNGLLGFLLTITACCKQMVNNHNGLVVNNNNKKIAYDDLTDKKKNISIAFSSQISNLSSENQFKFKFILGYGN